MTPRNHAIDLFNRAQPLIQTDPRLAYQMLASSVVTDPSFADGWALLGAALADLGSLPASCEAYRSALRLPDSLEPGGMTPTLRHRCLLQLGHRLTHQTVVSWHSLDEATHVLEQAISMGDAVDIQTTAFCHTNVSLIAAHRGWEIAELVEAEKGFEMHADPATELGLAFACLFQGQYYRGLKHFEARFPYQLGSYLSLPAPRWDGGHVETLYVLSEQGLGDALSFARFIPEAASRVGKLVYPVQPTLVTLLTDTFRGIENVEIVPQDRVIEYADAWCPVFSLPLALGLTDTKIVSRGFHASIKPVENTSWKNREARLHVALAWAGAPNNGIDFHRSIPFPEFLALRRVPGIALYSIQVGDRAKDMHDLGCSALVKDMSPWITSARDTAGIMGEMDCVVTCESFVGHLAGAIGKRCLLLASRFGRDWRVSPSLGDNALWYPQHRVVRQGDDCSWAPVFEQAVEMLSNKDESW